MNYPNLYERLPYYARVSDARGILELLCDRAIQPELDRFYEIIANRNTLYDPYHSDSDRILDFLGQFFGLQTVSPSVQTDRRHELRHWQGIGLNPNWTRDSKRKTILQISDYWRKKGTEEGIKLALELWLEWENPQIKFTYPYRNFRNWFSYRDKYTNNNASPINRKQLGSGDYFPGVTYHPRWQIIEDHTLSFVNESIKYSKSRLGSKNAWLQLYPEDINWNKINQNIVSLNPEIWDANISVTNICWLTIEIDKISDGDIWLVIATKKYSYTLRPYKDNDTLTFLFRSRFDGDTITNIELIVDRAKVVNYVPQIELFLTKESIYGVRVEEIFEKGIRALGYTSEGQLKELFSLSKTTYNLEEVDILQAHSLLLQVDGINFEEDNSEQFYPFFGNTPFIISSNDSDSFFYHTGNKLIINRLGAIEIIDESELGTALLFGRHDNYILVLRNNGISHSLDIYDSTPSLLDSRPILSTSGFIPRCAFVNRSSIEIAGSAQINDDNDNLVFVCASIFLPLHCLDSGSEEGECDLNSNLEFLTVSDTITNELNPLQEDSETPSFYRRGTIIGIGSYLGETYLITYYQDNIAFLVRKSDSTYLGRFFVGAYTPSPMVEFDNKLFFFSREAVLYFDGITIVDASNRLGLPVATPTNQFTSLNANATQLAIGKDNTSEPFLYDI